MKEASTAQYFCTQSRFCVTWKPVWRGNMLRSLGVPLQTYFTVVAIKLPYKCVYRVSVCCTHAARQSETLSCAQSNWTRSSQCTKVLATHVPRVTQYSTYINSTYASCSVRHTLTFFDMLKILWPLMQMDTPKVFFSVGQNSSKLKYKLYSILKLWMVLPHVYNASFLFFDCFRVLIFFYKA
jgi:hypothetical protein